MESLSRLRLYENMLSNDEKYNDHLRNLLNINLHVLRNVERFFLSDDNNPQDKPEKDPNIFQTLISNIESMSDIVDDHSDASALIDRLKKFVDDSKNPEMKSRNLFNKLMNELGAYNTKQLENRGVPVDDRERGELPQVFLSHAYDDRLYTFALFEYFYERGVYLYVDWMHHGKSVDGRELKKYLTEEINKSKQLLFLRTLNSELDIQGKQMLRSWCAWELGNFYRKENSDDPQKYFLNLYSVDGYSNMNIQLHGMKLFAGVNNGRMEGEEIRL